jgi:hypothetical protein
MWHYRNYPKAAGSRRFPKNLQPPAPIAGVHLAAGSNRSVSGLFTFASSPATQTPIFSSYSSEITSNGNVLVLKYISPW